ncbi:methionyl-tRNA formyltransferase [Paenibacillus macquariensis]|uniref:Methionyl-tRNA formyltransferase n=1 Tax=Paenibacillus macquariensis TaxID=948756 RepID=A0ABY1JL11_9BACL|nr:methionyl-tRNA formyltransferase [Paenibacillus macquariensis]MEC0090053.1 methionyl-tRNA formyltransferase [Paenibacillus macquariensis]OAB31066.1 methionyl-tRNA formyltransferase [Paenibacillus macquariensis subsp. macquariensis]SIQ36814.1 methionyl-tRNA formyltransferase [Paenibacillus macquariensis]
MNIVFMGTPAFAVPSLRMLLENGYNVVAVVTQPDRPQGRKRVLTPTPVKEVALEYGLPVLQPQRMRSPEAVAELAAYKPDLIVTAAYGQILPKAVLDLPSRGCVNIHGSLLPKYRGGAPIQRSIMNGEAVTGITLMYMAEGLDTGDMIAQVEVVIEDEDTSGTIFEKLSIVGATLLQEQLGNLLEGEVTSIPQNDDEATYSPNLKREDEQIDWSRSARDIYNQVRGLVPFSGAFTIWGEEVFKIWAVTPSSESSSDHSVVPGTVLQLNERGIEVKTGDGSIWLTKVQPSGKKVLEVDAFIRGTSMVEGTVLT